MNVRGILPVPVAWHPGLPTMLHKRLWSITGRPGYQATVPGDEIHTPVDIAYRFALH